MLHVVKLLRGESRCAEGEYALPTAWGVPRLFKVSGLSTTVGEAVHLNEPQMHQTHKGL